MRLLVTGDRNWRNARRIAAIFDSFGLMSLNEEGGVTLIEGEAMGADIISAVVWEMMVSQWNQDYVLWPEAPTTIERYPANWREHGRRAGPIRNQQMLDSGVDQVIAFHDDIESSKGTRDMLRRCARAGIPGRLFTQTGEVTDWRERIDV